MKQDSWTTTHRVTFTNDEDQERWFNSTPPNIYNFLCYREVESKVEVQGKWSNSTKLVKEEIPIGLLTITITDPVTHVAQIGGSIFVNHRGTEWSAKAWEAGTDFAFEMFNLHRVDGEVLENNIAALMMDVKLGYEIEGIRRKAVYKSGVYLDSYVVGYLRQDWEKSALDRYKGICNLNYKPRVASEKLLNRLGVQVPPQPVFVKQVVTPDIDLDGLSTEDFQKQDQVVS